MPAFLAVAWISASYGETVHLVADPMPFYSLVYGFLSKGPSWLPGFAGFILTTSQVFHLNIIVQKHEVLYKNSYLPALFYLMLIAIIPPFLVFNPVLIVNSFLIFILDKLFKIYKSSTAQSLSFDTCFLISIATLFYLPAICLFLLFAISILILKTFSWRDFVTGLIGLAIPFFFTFLYYFWFNGLEELADRFFLRNFRQLWNTGGLELQGYRVTLGLLLTVFVLTMVRIRQNFYKNVTRIRNFQQVIFILLGVAILSLLFTSGLTSVYRFSILVIPLSVMISYYFLAAKKKWWSETLFWMILGVLIFNHLTAL